jgi:hypothetical protein
MGCNQKTAREPVLAASDGEVQGAVDGLKLLSLAFESSGSRVSRYEHNLGRALALPSQSVALLATLMLRGAQTTGELRINSERLHRFADVSAVDAFLRELAARAAGALVEEMPRAAGERENRWVHLLSGHSAIAAMLAPAAAATAPETIALSELAALKTSIAEMRVEIDSLRASIVQLREELGAAPER